MKIKRLPSATAIPSGCRGGKLYVILEDGDDEVTIGIYSISLP